MNIAQSDRNKESFISSFPEIRPGIVEYVFGEIVPRYAAFDPAHREDHACDVIENSMDLYRRAPEEVKGKLDPEILFVAAACYVVFALFYVLVYLVTSREYYKIVSGKER